MPPLRTDSSRHPLRLEGSFGSDDLIAVRAMVEEGMNALTLTRVDVATSNRQVDLETLIGAHMAVVIDTPEGTRRFPGTCTKAHFLGADRGHANYALELSPWLWFLGRARECRIFQDMTAPDIVRQIVGDHGFGGHLVLSLSDDYPTRTICVQYRETDLDFVNRLMEEEGIYYWFDTSDPVERMVMADGPGAHAPIAGDPSIEYHDKGTGGRAPSEYVSLWSESMRPVTGTVTLNDYDFESPRAQLAATSAIPKGRHPQKDVEAYDHPGHYRKSAAGDRYARIRMESLAIRHRGWAGVTNIPRMAVGATFDLKRHPRTIEPGTKMIVRAVHRMQLLDTDAAGFATGGASSAEMQFDMEGNYGVTFYTVLKSDQFRAPQDTAWPQIAGIQTAVVTGPSGQEIHTDNYGRIRVQFHWDRLGRRDDTSTCWVRTMQPWTGKGWGMMAVPRIGQEVVVQFEEGDPDRPLVVGMLYNADTMPPWALPGNMTQSGIKTNSTKGGDGYNELMFEDKKGAELIRMHAERDFEQVIENDARITVGLEDKDKGDMDLTVHNDLTEEVKTGHHKFKVARGTQHIHIASHKTETIGGDSKNTTTGDVAETVEDGDKTEDIKKGSVTRTIDMGDEATTLKMGNWTLDASLGKVAITAMQEITLTVGGSSVKVDQMGVTIKAPTVSVEGQLKTDIKGLMTSVSGDVILTLKGTVTMIN